jgi:hypothetical protein
MLEPNLIAERDRILFGQPIDWPNRQYPPGVCERFEQLDAEGAEKLIQLGCLKPEKTMNGTPKFQAFVKFARSMQAAGYKFYLEGFTHDPQVHAGEVQLEGIYYQGDYPAEIGLAFARFVTPYRPDEVSLDPNYLRAWWD